LLQGRFWNVRHSLFGFGVGGFLLPSFFGCFLFLLSPFYLLLSASWLVVFFLFFFFSCLLGFFFFFFFCVLALPPYLVTAPSPLSPLPLPTKGLGWCRSFFGGVFWGVGLRVGGRGSGWGGGGGCVGGFWWLGWGGVGMCGCGGFLGWGGLCWWCVTEPPTLVRRPKNPLGPPFLNNPGLLPVSFKNPRIAPFGAGFAQLQVFPFWLLFNLQTTFLFELTRVPHPWGRPASTQHVLFRNPPTVNIKGGTPPGNTKA